MRVNLSAVSTNGTSSYTGSFYNYGGDPTNFTGILRFENFDFTTGGRNASYPSSSTLALSTSLWYRLEFTLATKNPNQAVLTVSLYNLAGGFKGGAPTSLIGTFSETRSDVSGDGMSGPWQFGLFAGPGEGRFNQDNFGAETIPPRGTVISIH